MNNDLLVFSQIPTTKLRFFFDICKHFFIFSANLCKILLFFVKTAVFAQNSSQKFANNSFRLSAYHHRHSAAKAYKGISSMVLPLW